jgi:hypothetical protein
VESPQNLQPDFQIDTSALPDISDTLINQQLTRWAYSAGEPLDVADRRCNLATIPRAKLTALKTFTFRGRKEDAEVLMAESDPVEIVDKIRTAGETALDLQRAYANMGLVIVDVLTGAREDYVRDVEQFIFDGEAPSNLVDLQEKLYLAKLKDSSIGGSQNYLTVVEKVIDTMIASAEAATVHQLAEIDLAETEVERRALPGGVGRPGYTQRDLFYFKQQKRVPKTKVMEDIAASQKDALRFVQQAAINQATAQSQSIQPSEQQHAFSDGRTPCIACAEPIQPEAKICRYCKEYQFEIPRKAGRPQKDPLSSFRKKAA